MPLESLLSQHSVRLSLFSVSVQHIVFFMISFCEVKLARCITLKYFFTKWLLNSDLLPVFSLKGRFLSAINSLIYCVLDVTNKKTYRHKTTKYVNDKQYTFYSHYISVFHSSQISINNTGHY